MSDDHYLRNHQRAVTAGKVPASNHNLDYGNHDTLAELNAKIAESAAEMELLRTGALQQQQQYQSQTDLAAEGLEGAYEDNDDSYSYADNVAGGGGGDRYGEGPGSDGYSSNVYGSAANYDDNYDPGENLGVLEALMRG